MAARMVCTRCGIIGADARPKWREQPTRLMTLCGRHIMRYTYEPCHQPDLNVVNDFIALDAAHRLSA
jgi:hypothetical protein